jgi:hypothetical protein
MDIPELSMALSMSQLQTNVGVAMLSKSLDMVSEASETLTQMMDSSMELSVNPDIGSNIDLRI